jgi:hypothetical protein
MISESLSERMQNGGDWEHRGFDRRLLIGVIQSLEERYQGQCWVEDRHHEALYEDEFWWAGPGHDDDLRGDHYVVHYNSRPDPEFDPAEIVVEDGDANHHLDTCDYEFDSTEWFILNGTTLILRGDEQDYGFDLSCPASLPAFLDRLEHSSWSRPGRGARAGTP